MPSQLKRYQQTRHLHYITFTCYHRLPHLQTAAARDLFEHTLERVRRWYGFYVIGYVVMPEHVHLLVSEPERSELAVAIQMLKQLVSRKLRPASSGQPLWQQRYYDFNLFSDRKQGEKLHYMHSNPVRRGLVACPEDWPWSSFRHYATGADGMVEIESQWTVRDREQFGVYPQVKRRDEMKRRDE
jgi:putative transposase